MHRPILVACLAAAVLLAGCSSVESPAGAAGTEDEEREDDRMDIIGTVRDADLLPMVGNVTLEEASLTIQTDARGDFAFEDLPVDFYTVTADAADHLPQTLTVTPGSNETLVFALRQFTQEATHDTVRFEGRMQCAAEYVIIAGACDRVLTEYGVDPVVDQASIFDVAVGTNWRTLVVDVVFDGQPGLDGLRVTVKGTNDSDSLGTYIDHGKFHASESFTFQLEPGGMYDGGDIPIAENATTVRFDVFGQGHGNGIVCDPDDTCFLGAGAGIDVKFELLVTAFFVEPAPAGFTLQ